MKKISDNSLGSIEFSVSFKHNEVEHTDCFYAQKVNLWRDILPPQLFDVIQGKKTGDWIELNFEPDTLVPARDRRKIYSVRRRQIATGLQQAEPIQPRFGRFYPQGILRDLPGIFPGNMAPFRCISANRSMIEADLNHALAGKQLKFSALINEVRDKSEERGGTSIDWAELALTGPGMQGRVNGQPTDFFSGHSFGRVDQSEDRLFYAKPRMVKHIDETAVNVIHRLYGQHIQPQSNVLDLMSSWQSHLPQGLPLKSLTGLGMNQKELEANSRLTDYVVCDLNADPRLPFDDHAFDAAVCTVSIEYLIYPFEVFEEIARVLKPGGLFMTTFSNRWFPPKAINIWSELHEFERMGLVLEFFFKYGQYKNLRTFSMRGLPRPKDDRHYSKFLFSDPVYAVWGFSQQGQQSEIGTYSSQSDTEGEHG